MTTKYNYLYNGNNLLNQGKAEINENVFDNYWEILPIEKTQITEDKINLKLKKEQSASLFVQSEKKAVLAIQKHAMNIAGKEKNPQMDEAYFLLGESRYYDQRFIPSLEAFNYILFKYPTSELVNKAKIWREKINAKQNYNQLAIENLKEIESRGRLSNEEIVISCESEDVLITFTVDDFTSKVKSNKKKTILDSALDNDIDAPYSCNGGVCGSCIGKLTKGEVKMLNNTVLSESEITDGLILACQAIAISDEVDVDFDDV